MAYDPELADRIRTALVGIDTREVKMFGGLSFMIEDKLRIGANNQGGLLVRVDPAGLPELLTRAGVQRAQMRGKPMSDGWLHIDPGVLTDDELRFWVAQALR